MTLTTTTTTTTNTTTTSPDGTKLISVGQDDKNTHILFSDAGGNWSRSTTLATEKGDQNAIAYTRWASSKNDHAEYQFVTGGGQSIFFWKIEGGSLTRKQGNPNHNHNLTL